MKNGFLILSYYFLLMAIEFRRKRKFVHKAEVKSLGAACYKDGTSFCQKKKSQQLKQLSQANFVHVFCTHISLQQLFSHPVKAPFHFINLHQFNLHNIKG